MLITFEGIEGAGKTTHMKLLSEKLRGLQFPTVLNTREPGFKGSRLSNIFKHLIEDSDMSTREKLFLSLADRAGHFHDVVRPLTAGGYGYPNPGVVLSDQGPDHMVAYEGFGRDTAPLPLLYAMNALAMENYQIHLTILLDAEVAISINRSSSFSPESKIDREFYERVRRGYLNIAESNPNRFLVFNTAQTIEEVQSQIWEKVSKRFNL